MTEFSYPWAGSATGDCGPYTDDQWSDMQRRLLQSDRTKQGVIIGDGSELAVTGASSPVSVASGAALVDGKFYYNTAAVNVTIATPSTSTRVDCIVLRKDFTAQTVRIVRIAGTEGAGAPAITQNDGTTWDIKLAEVSITTGGVITITDFRARMKAMAGIGTQKMMWIEFDGGGSAIVPDVVKGGTWLLPDFTVSGWEILEIEGNTGYIELLFCADTYANFPADAADDMVGIHLGKTRPRLNGVNKNQGLTCDWNDKVVESLKHVRVFASGYLGAITFTGGGLNDMKMGANARFTLTTNINYKVEIDGTGSPNTFKWSDDGGSTWDATTVSITGGDQTLNNGVTIRFGATTGHTSGNNWAWTATAITAKHVVLCVLGDVT